MSDANLNQTVADWIRSNREGSGVTQTRLATMMTAEGFAWHAATVARLESGEQPAKYAEVFSLARLLRADPPVPAGHHPMACPVCLGSPPKDFTCNACGKGGPDPQTAPRLSLAKTDTERGSVLCSLRQQMGLSQTEVAKRMRLDGWEGWHQSTVARTEAGERPIRLDEYIALTQIFSVSEVGERVS